jgi:vancomycin resistance protein YoaR
MATQTLRQTDTHPTPARSALRWRIALILGVVAVVLIAGAALAAKWVDESTRVPAQVRVGDLVVGGMTRAEAEAAIRERFAGVVDTPVTLQLGDRVWTYPARDLGAALDTAAVATAAYNAGRNGNAAITPVALVFTHDQAQAATVLETLATGVAVAPVDAQLDESADGVVIRPAAEGRQLDAAATWQAITDATAQYPFRPAEVAVAAVPPTVADKDLAEAAALAHRLSDQPLDFTATIDEQTKTWTLDVATLRDMVVIGKDGTGKATVAEQLDETKLRAHLQAMATEIAREAVNARLDLPDFKTVVNLTPDVSARDLDVDTSLRRAQAAALVSGTGRTVQLAVVETPAPVQAAELQPLKDKLDRVMRDGITLQGGGNTYRLAGERLALFIYLEPGEDGSAASYQVRVEDSDMARLAQAIAKEVNVPVREARYRLVNKQITVVQQPSDGLALDVDATAANIKAAVLAGQAQADLVTHVVHPVAGMVDTSTIETPDLLASGSTDYRNSSAERNRNVTFGASKLDGWYIPPGATFSLNEALGDLTLEAGFKMGWAILVEAGNATTIPSEAGGICQVATTLYHSVFWTGLPVTEYHHHSYWISTYGQKPDGMQGLDATISPPWSDFQFRNTTGNWILIKAKGDTKTLTVQLYGTNPNWQIKVNGPKITNIVKTDQTPREQTNDKLPQGRRVMVEHAQDGFTSTIERTVLDQNGNTLDHWTITNNYLPSHNTYVTGTGKDVPTPTPAAPAATPVPTP